MLPLACGQTESGSEQVGAPSTTAAAIDSTGSNTGGNTGTIDTASSSTTTSVPSFPSTSGVSSVGGSNATSGSGSGDAVGTSSGGTGGNGSGGAHTSGTGGSGGAHTSGTGGSGGAGEEPSSWSTPVVVVANGINPRIAMNDAGTAVVGWTQQLDYGELWAMLYTRDSGWGAADPIASYDSLAGLPRVAINDAGFAALTWDALGARPLVASLHDPAAPDPWGPAEFVAVSEDSRGYNPDLAIDASGRTVVVWMEDVIETGDEADNELWSNTWTPDAGWGNPVPIRQALNPENPAISMNDTGNAVVVWAESGASDITVRGTHAEAGTGWAEPTSIQTAGQFGVNPQVAIDPEGNAMAVWWQNDFQDRGPNIWANRFSAGTGWGEAELIDAGRRSYFPLVGVDDAGNATALWVEEPGYSQIWANRHTPDSGWGTPELISTEDFICDVPALAVGPAGDAVAVWRQTIGTYSQLWSNRYLPVAGWGDPEVIDASSTNVGTPDVAIDGAGNAITVWDGAEGDVWRSWASTASRP